MPWRSWAYAKRTMAATYVTARHLVRMADSPEEARRIDERQRQAEARGADRDDRPIVIAYGAVEAQELADVTGLREREFAVQAAGGAQSIMPDFWIG